MMERNDESLSTRDLATQADPPESAVTSPPDGLRRADSSIAGPPPIQDDPVQAPDPTQAPSPDRRFDSSRGDQSESQAAVPEEASAARQTSAEADAASPPPNAGDPAPSPATEAGTSAPLLAPELGATFQRRWEDVQTRFVDEPRGAVEDADGLVANLMQQLAEGFAQERERLEAQWGRGEDISTEDLRVALQRYRSFFQRLLST